MDKLSEILARTDTLRAELSALRPLGAAQISKLNEALYVEYTYESNRIEGNTLTLAETALVVQKGLTIAGKSMREHLEAVNHYEAIGFIQTIADRNEPLTDRTVRDIHALVLRGIDKENAGRYRTVNVMISGSTHTPPDALHVASHMDEYFAFYEQGKDAMHPVLLAAHLHEKLVTIHPFTDGNGRTSRLVMNLVLLMHGYTQVNISGSAESRLQYYSALDMSRNEPSNTTFLVLVATGTQQSLERYLKIVRTGNSAP